MSFEIFQNINNDAINMRNELVGRFLLDWFKFALNYKLLGDYFFSHYVFFRKYYVIPAILFSSIRYTTLRIPQI